MPKVAVLVLAAGASTRMGKPKQLLPWKNTTLLGHVISNLRVVSKHILVVLGANHEKILPTLPSYLESVINIAWQSGMGTSIALGVGELEKSVNPEAILICLVDQPLIDAELFKKIIDLHNLNPSKIIATTYVGGKGVPALFPKKYFNALKQFSADYGARHFLKSNKNEVIPFDSDGKAVDLDTPANYDAYWKKHGRELL
ncbi:nucleotidyltransferase family protein [Croceivirga thetidis]|uniref:Nucleotidyltransferase family protein n=1 Tax=Croceivirga thetidis TaxID=2721623 RepID=A0ABX1GTR5_9FLAO|nr:nucleotidyltransferase family protein [Croceivirga thetidis]NKI32310.1 nucleotidyltransferase family protein [Croceivirga thetidis]